jgi:hypothetical protein
MTPNPLPQSDAYANTLRALGTAARLDRIEEAGRRLIQTRRLPFLGAVNLISRGPVGLSDAESSDYLTKVDVEGPLILNRDHTSAARHRLGGT